MRVAIEGQLYACVSCEVLDELGMHAPAEKQSEARVPEVVPANVGQPCSPEQRLEVAVDNVLRIERCPIGLRHRSSTCILLPEELQMREAVPVRHLLSCALLRTEAVLVTNQALLPPVAEEASRGQCRVAIVRALVAYPVGNSD